MMKVSVYAFFIISGWVLTWRYGDTINSKKSLKDYWQRRIRRIWPLYFCVLGLAWLLGDVPNDKLLATVFFSIIL